MLRFTVGTLFNPGSRGITDAPFRYRVTSRSSQTQTLLEAIQKMVEKKEKPKEKNTQRKERRTNGCILVGRSRILISSIDGSWREDAGTPRGTPSGQTSIPHKRFS